MTAAAGAPPHEGLAALAAMQEGFAAAAERAPGSCREHHLVLAGERSRWRIAGAGFSDRLMAPMKHLVVDPDPVGVDDSEGLIVGLWDEEETGIGLPVALPPEGQSYAADGRVAIHSEPGAVTFFDRAKRQVWGWRRSREGGNQEGWRALPGILPLVMIDRGISMIHCGLAGTAERGILIAGLGGAGKSTTSVACAVAGLQFAADDFAAIEWPPAEEIEAGNGRWIGHSLSSSARVDPAAIESFPGLVPDGAGRIVDDKVMLDVGELGAVARRLPIDAVVVLRVGAERTRLSPASPGRALLAFGLNSLIIFPGGGSWGMANLATMLRSLPCLWLDVRGGPDEAAAVIADLAHGRQPGGARA